MSSHADPAAPPQIPGSWTDPDGRPVYFAAPASLPEIEKLNPVLRGTNIDLLPLAAEHFDALLSAGSDPVLFRFYTHSYHTPEAMRGFVSDAVQKYRAGIQLPFVVRLSDGQVVGTTRFLNIDRANRRLEIGSTWYAKAHQGTGVNSEAKYLLLSYAFEVLGCIRVEFKTDSFNKRSRAALSAIGATQEGVFRNHMIAESGRLRHSVYFSITHDEWPRVKAKLEQRMEKSRLATGA